MIELGAKEGCSVGAQDQCQGNGAFVCSQTRAHALQTKLAEFADGKLKGEKLAKAKERCAALALRHPFFTPMSCFSAFCFQFFSNVVVPFRAKAAKKLSKGKSVQFA